VGQVQADGLDRAPLGPDVCEEHDQRELEEDDRVDRRAPTGGVGVADEVAEEAEVEGAFEAAVEMARGDRRV